MRGHFLPTGKAIMTHLWKQFYLQKNPHICFFHSILPYSENLTFGMTAQMQSSFWKTWWTNLCSNKNQMSLLYYYWKPSPQSLKCSIPRPFLMYVGDGAGHIIQPLNTYSLLTEGWHFIWLWITNRLNVFPYWYKFNRVILRLPNIAV